MAEAISEESDPDRIKNAAPAEKWQTALVSLISARVAIMSAEGRVAAEIYGRKVGLALAALIFAVISWLILMAAVIGFGSILSGLPWYAIAFMLFGLHLVVAFAFAVAALRDKGPVFTVTRSEFRKDYSWLNTVKNQQTSDR